MESKRRILSGMRPTGPLHLGNYHGALANWVRLQAEYECFFFVADWHALTSDYENPAPIRGYTREILLDWLAAGIDPEASTLFIQSHLPEHAELYLLLGMITPVPWLERNPTYKEQIEQLQNRDLSTYGFLGYPVLQAADIILYKPFGVPVGVDQAPHVEITREIARRFNFLYGPVFPEPQVILTQTPKLLGTDRRKMSKSYGNAIFLNDSPEAVAAKVATMITDPQRMRRSDPGNPEVCNVFDFHKLYSPPELVAEVDRACRTAGIGCVECKKLMAGHLNAFLEPMRARRRHYESEPQRLERIIAAGNEKARRVAQATLEEVRRAVGLR